MVAVIGSVVTPSRFSLKQGLGSTTTSSKLDWKIIGYRSQILQLNKQ